MTGLVAFLSRNWDAVEADFTSRYGLDLRAACWGPGRVGVRRLHALVVGLPWVEVVKPAPPKPSGWRALAQRMTGGGRG